MAKYDELQQAQLISGQTYLTLGDTEVILKQFDKAARDYQKALDKFRLLPDTYEQRALAENKLREATRHI